MITEFDYRQLQILKDTIFSLMSRYYKTSIFCNNVNKIRDVIDILESTDDLWKEKLVSAWWELEYICSVQVHEKKQELSNEDRCVIKKVLECLSELIRPQMIEKKNEKLSCRICGFRQDHFPWGENNANPSFEICDCCSVQFGIQDTDLTSIREYRNGWIKNGASWNKSGKKDQYWSLENQLKNIPHDFQ